MRSRRPRWLCAHILMLLVFLAAGFVTSARPAISSEGTGESVLPEAGGGGGGFGDPDQPQDPPKFVAGGDPEYTVYSPSDPGASYRGQFGGVQIVGRNNSSVWQWHVRFLFAGLRYYLRF